MRTLVVVLFAAVWVLGIMLWMRHAETANAPLPQLYQEMDAG